MFNETAPGRSLGLVATERILTKIADLYNIADSIDCRCAELCGTAGETDRSAPPPKTVSSGRLEEIHDRLEGLEAKLHTIGNSLSRAV